MGMTPSILTNEGTVANQLATDGQNFLSSSFSPGGSMAPTVVNNYNGSTYGQGQLLNQSTNTSGGAFGLSPNQIGNIAGKGVKDLFSPSDTFKNITSSINNFGTDFGFGGPGSGVASSAGDLATAGISDVSTGVNTSLGTIGGDTSFLSGSNSSQLTSLFGDALNGGGAPGSGAFSGASAGADAFSSGASAGDALGINPTSAGAFTDASLSSVLGAAGLGALGGSLLANLTGGNATGGSIGGGLGAGIGMAFGGPVGALVGGIGGSLVGGMFGNNTPATSASVFGENLQMVSNGEAPTLTGKNSKGNFNSTLASDFNTQVNAAAKTLGITLNPNVNVQGGSNTLYSGDKNQPGYLKVGMGQQNPVFDNGTINFVPGNPASQNGAIQQAVIQALKASGASDDQIKQYQNSVSNTANGTAAIQTTPNVTPQAGSFASTVAQQRQGTVQNATSTATPNV